MFNNFSRKSCHLCDNMEKYGTARQATDGNIVWRLRVACWINKTADTRSVYVIFMAFPRWHWLRERISMLFYTYSAYPIHAASEFCREKCLDKTPKFAM
jgi:hypothetical protein